MTAPAAAAPASSTSLAVQAVIAQEAARIVTGALPQLKLEGLAADLPQFKLAVAGVVRRYGHAAGSAALQFYLAQRADAGIAGRITLRPASPPTPQHVGEAVNWATRPLRGEPDVPAAEKQLEAVVERLVLNTGRNTIIDASRQDKQAKGWARVPEAGACSFCALLATRGAVYKQDTAGFRAHDHCRCHVEPVFHHYEPNAQIREWQRIYSELPHGKPADVRRAFRRALGN